jgi:hypothetical protein
VRRGGSAATFQSTLAGPICDCVRRCLDGARTPLVLGGWRSQPLGSLDELDQGILRAARAGHQKARPGVTELGAIRSPSGSAHIIQGPTQALPAGPYGARGGTCTNWRRRQTWSIGLSRPGS